MWGHTTGFVCGCVSLAKDSATRIDTAIRNPPRKEPIEDRKDIWKEEKKGRGRKDVGKKEDHRTQAIFQKSMPSIFPNTCF